MKLYKSLIIGAALALSATSCNDWLDINTDPNAKPIKFDVTVDKWKDTTPGDDLNLTDKKN